jgi:hypothetical protein
MILLFSPERKLCLCGDNPQIPFRQKLLKSRDKVLRNPKIFNIQTLTLNLIPLNYLINEFNPLNGFVHFWGEFFDDLKGKLNHISKNY